MYLKRYYLVSFAHNKGFGNIFYIAKGHLDIRAAEKEIKEKYGNQGVVILCVNKINKKQFVAARDDER